MADRNENENFISNENTPNDIHDDVASVSSQRSLTGGRSASLLERIQRQRELEAKDTSNAAINGSTSAIVSVAALNGNTSTTEPEVPQQNLLPSLLPQQIQIPQYGQPSMPGFGNTTNDITTSTPQPPPPPQGYLNNAWNSFTQSMESSMMAADKSQLNMSPSYDGGGDEMHHALLQQPSSTNDFTTSSTGHHPTHEYSISQYFLTFVKDVYGLFIWLPIAVRIVVVAGLLYIVVKFI